MVPDSGNIVWTVSGAQTREILAEDDTQHPVEAVVVPSMSYPPLANRGLP